MSGGIPNAEAQDVFNVFCDTVDPGTALCRVLPDGPKTTCIAASGGIAKCIQPSSQELVNCVPYQAQYAGALILQLNCSSVTDPLVDPIQQEVFQPDGSQDQTKSNLGSSLTDQSLTDPLKDVLGDTLQKAPP